MRCWTFDDAEDRYEYPKDERVEESKEVFKKFFFEYEIYVIRLKENRKAIRTK